MHVHTAALGEVEGSPEAVAAAIDVGACRGVEDPDASAEPFEQDETQ